MVVIAAVILTGIAAVLVVAVGDNVTVKNPPITFRYVKTGEFNNQGYISTGTVFWATNHTSKTLFIALSAVEVKSGSNWLSQSRAPIQMEMLEFQPAGKPSPLPYLDPHQAGYATLQLASEPTGGTWRVRARVQERLTGVPEMSARVKTFLGGILGRRSTSSRGNSFSKGMNFFGPPREVLSQEISGD